MLIRAESRNDSGQADALCVLLPAHAPLLRMLPIRLCDLHVSPPARPSHRLSPRTHPAIQAHTLLCLSSRSYDLYLEDLEHHHALLSEAKQKILALERVRTERVPEALWPPEFGPRSAAPADEGTVKDQAKRELEQARAALPPSMRAFLEMEERMKARQGEVKV